MPNAKEGCLYLGLVHEARRVRGRTERKGCALGMPTSSRGWCFFTKGDEPGMSRAGSCPRRWPAGSSQNVPHRRGPLAEGVGAR